MRPFILTLIFLLSPGLGWAAYPYDSVCEITAPTRDLTKNSGGSATLVAVSPDKALLLTCQHVVLFKDNTVQVTWTATGEQSEGVVVAVGADGLDVALVVCPRPKDIRPVPMARPYLTMSGRITNVGYAGHRGILEWQTGKLNSIGYSSIKYSCRPVPGMSGGATFDQYGNLIGVIISYSRYGGRSTSGVAFLKFLRGYDAKEDWKAAIPAFKDPIPGGQEEHEISAPKDWAEYRMFLFIFYDIPLEEGECL